MNAVMISIQPIWVEKILSSEKTVDVRKTKPKLQIPFKCYIYCTKSGGHHNHIYVNEKEARNKYGVANHWSEKQQIVEVNGSKNNPNNYLAYECYLAEGKVVAEFTCNEVYQYSTANCDGKTISRDDIERMSCLSQEQLSDYEFFAKAKDYCIYNIGLYGWHISDLVVYDNPKELIEFYTERITTTDYPKLTKMNRPPQSWCYVEELR